MLMRPVVRAVPGPALFGATIDEGARCCPETPTLFLRRGFDGQLCGVGEVDERYTVALATGDVFSDTSVSQSAVLSPLSWATNLRYRTLTKSSQVRLASAVALYDFGEATAGLLEDPFLEPLKVLALPLWLFLGEAVFPFPTPVLFLLSSFQARVL
jgi:hypothetical protein